MLSFLNRLVQSLLVFWLLLAVPALLMLWTFANDPASAFDLIPPSGEMSVRMVIAAMAISPLQVLLGRHKWLSWLLQRRRSLGVAACCYGLLHLSFYLIDMSVWAQILKEARIASIWTGYLALAIFIVMGLTSNSASQKLLKRNWKRLQRMVYPSALLIALHWVWVDGDVAGAAQQLGPLVALEILRLIALARRRLLLRSPVEAC